MILFFLSNYISILFCGFFLVCLLGGDSIVSLDKRVGVEFQNHGTKPTSDTIGGWEWVHASELLCRYFTFFSSLISFLEPGSCARKRQGGEMRGFLSVFFRFLPLL